MSLTVEQTAITIAAAYSEANGYAPADRGAIGLVLAGMAIASASSNDALAELLVGYLETFPDSRRAIEGWARQLSAAAGGGPVR